MSATGVVYDPWARAASRRLPPPLDLYRRAVAYKANPRSREYMESLFAGSVAGGRLVDAASIPASLADADRVVLLYPDAIGVGFGRLERRILEQLPGGARLWALNGRRRLFELTPGTRRRLAFRRFLEVTMLPEAVLTVPFAAFSVPLALIDLVRGHR